MKTRHLVALSILAGFGTSHVFAQARSLPPLKPTVTPPAAASAPVAPTANPAQAPAEEPATSTTDSAKPARSVSSGVSAAISAGMPKYNPQPKPAPKPAEELADLRETDKPRNQIIRLPEVMVREPKNPILTERAVNTKESLTALAERRYISDSDQALNRFRIPLFGTSNQARAMAMYEADERLRNIADLNDAAAMASTTDKAAGEYIKRESQKTYLRSADFGWKGTTGREDRGINDASTAPR